MSAEAPSSAMISYTAGGVRFNYRVAAVAIADGRVLLHRAEADPFWALPGGRAELMETARDTLQREMHEELGQAVTVGRLLWVVENFYTVGDTRNHELALYFALTFNDPAVYQQHGHFFGDEQGTPLIFGWYPLTQLATITLLPSFLGEKLLALPTTTEHLIHHDAED